MYGPKGGEDYATMVVHAVITLGILSLTVTIAPYTFFEHPTSFLWIPSTIFGYAVGALLWY